MRVLLVAVPLLALAACKGASVETAGGTAAPSGPVSGGSGGGVAFASGTVANGATTTGGTTFLNTGSAKTLNANSGLQSLSIDLSTGAELYTGNASTVRAPGGTVAYDPRDGIFTLTLQDTKANVSTEFRYQDPAHRTANAQAGVPELSGFNYLEGIGSGDGDMTTTDATTFFYQRPGESTNYVTLAGYVRNSVPETGTAVYERGAMVFGEPTAMAQVPTKGTGQYTGGMLASMIGGSATQWIAGSSTVSVDFAKNSVALALTGTVGPGAYANQIVPDSALLVPTGAIFSANGTATLDLVKSGGFTGQFQNAGFTFTRAGGTPQTLQIAITPVSAGTSTAGASSIDGAFYGPNAVNVGGSFRIVGGIPDQRVDIVGAFTGAAK